MRVLVVTGDQVGLAMFVQASTTTTTPFDMVVLNDLDRFHLAGDVIDRVESLGASAAYLKQHLSEKLIEHKQYIRRHGEDMPEIRDWRWTGKAGKR